MRAVIMQTPPSMALVKCFLCGIDAYIWFLCVRLWRHWWRAR